MFLLNIIVDYVYNVLFNVFWMMVSGLLNFCVLRKHVLLTLLSLQMLNCVYFCLLVCNFPIYFLSMLLISVVFLVCGGVLGLCLFASLIHVSGNDYIWGLGMLC